LKGRCCKGSKKEAALSLAARKSPWQLSHSPPPRNLSTHHCEKSVCGIYTYLELWEGGKRSQQAKATQAKAGRLAKQSPSVSQAKLFLKFYLASFWGLPIKAFVMLC